MNELAIKIIELEKTLEKGYISKELRTITDSQLQGIYIAVQTLNVHTELVELIDELSHVKEEL